MTIQRKEKKIMGENRNSHYWVNRNQRKKKAEKHVLEVAVKCAVIACAGGVDPIKNSIQNTRLYDDNIFSHIAKRPIMTKELSVIDMDSAAAVFHYYDKDKKMAVLNFASYKHPGGMFLQGSCAQEESLCHASALYNVLSKCQSFYDWNNQHKNRALYLNRALYSPDVPFFSGKGDLNWIIDCDVITCAAPNRAAAQKYCHVSDAENHEVLESRIRFVLSIAEHEQVDTLILGAFGSGVFGQDGTEVAEIFKKLLVEEFWTFEKIIFAIPNDTKNGNYQKFMNVMSDVITRKD